METLLFAVEDAPRSMLPIVATGLFFAVILAIAAWGMKKTNDTNDFFLGGRTLGPWILALSYGASYFSAVVFIGFAGTYGWLVSFKSLWIGLANGVVGGLAAWLVLGRATRKMTRNLDSATIPEFFAQRYGSNFMKILGAAVIFVFLLPYSASVFAGLTYLFKEVFNISMTSALTIITVATGVYLVVGGYKAAARIDFLQGAIIFFGALFMALFAFSYFAKDYGGFAGVVERSMANYQARLNGEMSAVQAAPFEPIPSWLFWSVVFMTSIAPWGLPQMAHKFYAIKDKDQIVKGAVVCCVFAIVVGLTAYGVGSLAHLLPEDALRSTLTSDGQTIDANRLVPTMLVACLPSWFLAVVLLLVLSASMSTLCSLALTSSAALSLDLVKGFVAPNASEKTHLAILRICCGIFIICSYFIALFNPSWIVALTALSWGAICGGFLAPYVYGLFWRGTTKSGAIAGMLAGIIVSNAFYWFLFFSEGAATAKKFSPVGASIAMVLPFIVVPVVSAMTKKLEPARVAKAFADEERVEIHVPVGEGSAAVVKGDSLDD
ncbi:MAG: sodium:solute symporter family protein [Thermoguttaceae bacterium]|jgi:SSS family solute:Na+ symporter